MGKRDNNRFITILKENHDIAEVSKIIKDKKTGVLYYFHLVGYAGGLTPLIDKDGKPLLDLDDDEVEEQPNSNKN